MTVLTDQNLRDAQAANGHSELCLEVENLHKSFLAPNGDRIEVLRGLSFSATAGQTVAIMGASGAGKSTLLHLIGGLEAADEGQIRLHSGPSQAVGNLDLARRRKDPIGFVFQFHHLLPDLSAAENVALPLMIAGIEQRDSLKQAADELKKIGLGDRLHHPVNYLSGGEQQRVAVARALILQPPLVLADEPTGNLAAVIEDEIFKTLIDNAHGQQNRRGILIVATHNERLALRCDRVLCLKDGTLHEQ